MQQIYYDLHLRERNERKTIAMHGIIDKTNEWIEFRLKYAWCMD